MSKLPGVNFRRLEKTRVRKKTMKRDEDDLFCKDGVKVYMQATPEQNDNVEIPVPALESIIGDRDKLITEQKEDEMLAEVRKQADARKGGYS